MDALLGYAVCPYTRREAVHSFRNPDYTPDAAKAKLYADFARVIKIAVGHIDTLDPELSEGSCNSFTDVVGRARSTLHQSVNKAWEQTSPLEQSSMNQGIVAVRGYDSISTPGNYAPVRIKQGVMTAAKVITRLQAAIPGFVHHQTGGQQISLDKWRQVCMNSWQLVYKRQLLHIGSLQKEPNLSHPYSEDQKTRTLSTLNDRYHTYNPAKESVELTTPFDEWEADKGLAGDSLFKEPAIGCPLSLLGPKATRRVVQYFTDLAYTHEVPLKDPLSHPFMLAS